MRREGYELQVSKPTIITREENGQTLEPIELLFVDVPEDYIGIVSQLLAVRKGIMTGMEHQDSGRVRLEFTRAVARPDRLPLALPHRDARHRHPQHALQRLRAVARPDPRPHQRRHGRRPRGVRRRPYAIFHLQERGTIFVKPGTPVYEGMIVGEYSRDNDLDVNLTKEKKLTNMRASGHDEATIITPPREMGLDAALEWIADDELVEVTPESVRMRKKVLQKGLRPKTSQA